MDITLKHRRFRIPLVTLVTAAAFLGAHVLLPADQVPRGTLTLVAFLVCAVAVLIEESHWWWREEKDWNRDRRRRRRRLVTTTHLVFGLLVAANLAGYFALTDYVLAVRWLLVLLDVFFVALCGGGR